MLSELSSRSGRPQQLRSTEANTTGVLTAEMRGMKTSNSTTTIFCCHFSGPIARHAHQPSNRMPAIERRDRFCGSASPPLRRYRATSVQENDDFAHARIQLGSPHTPVKRRRPAARRGAVTMRGFTESLGDWPGSSEAIFIVVEKAGRSAVPY